MCGDTGEQSHRQRAVPQLGISGKDRLWDLISPFPRAAPANSGGSGEKARSSFPPGPRVNRIRRATGEHPSRESLGLTPATNLLDTPASKGSSERGLNGSCPEPLGCHPLLGRAPFSESCAALDQAHRSVGLCQRVDQGMTCALRGRSSACPSAPPALERRCQRRQQRVRAGG